MEQAQKIKQICVHNELRVATAESLTAGHVQSLIASVSGASDFFCGGITAYNIDQKVKHLGVDRIHAAGVDCVSPQVAAEMALGATEMFDAHIGVSTTGYAEPPGRVAPLRLPTLRSGTPGGLRSSAKERWPLPAGTA